MKINLLKTILYIGSILVVTSTWAGLMDKKMLLETISDATSRTLCSPTYTNCFGVTKEACEADIKEITENQCSSDVPEVMEDLDEVRAMSSSISACLTSTYTIKHKKSMGDNIEACKKLSK